ncbi:hypothetical protein V496_02260 [Pseudogymnoascus sp. VKM F-4515 (FW-2607)]|nr:hypothetical protein V496_02260 [Pseudogymnoascus sp. VKM F-4515 (FW-2607)]
MLLIATTIDANDNLLPLAWALVPTENVEWWSWFLGFVQEHFSWANSNNMVFISDRDKGIASAINTHFPNGNQAHCCQHIAANVQNKFGLTCRNQFWKVARAKDKTTLKEQWKIMQEQNYQASCYLRDIPFKMWTTYHFPWPRYGHDTSNIAESLNSSWSDEIPEFECSCSNFWQFQAPCTHAICAARHDQIDPITLFDTTYYLST